MIISFLFLVVQRLQLTMVVSAVTSIHKSLIDYCRVGLGFRWLVECDIIGDGIRLVRK